MDFEHRTVEWERFLQLKAEVVGSFSQQSACRVCCCLELLKLSVCPENCHAETSEERELVVHRLVEGVLDEDLFTLLKEELLKHDHSLQTAGSSERHLLTFEAELARLKNELANYDMPGLTNRLTAVIATVDSLQPPADITPRISDLEATMKSYETKFESLFKENGDLRDILKSVSEEQRRGNSSLRRELIRSNSGLRKEFIEQKDEVGSLKTNVEDVSRQLSDNTAQLLLITKQRTELGQEQLEGLMLELSEQKAGLMEEVERLNEATKAKVELLQGQYETITLSIRGTRVALDAFSKEQSELKDWKKVDLDSQHQVKALQLTISQSLDTLRQEIEALKAGRITKLELRQEALMKSNERHQVGMLELRKQSKQVVKKLEVIAELRPEVLHTGKFEFNSELGVPCWSCCKTSRDSKGCVKRKT
jgi:hypothetical protein